jgi:hypothetical protein
MRVARQGVHDEDGVLARAVQFAPRLVGERDLLQGAAEFRLERTYAVVKFAEGTLGRSLPSPGPRV